MKVLVCFFRRRGGGGDLSSGGEEYGFFGSVGLGCWIDCIDVNYFFFKDFCYILRFLWEWFIL